MAEHRTTQWDPDLYLKYRDERTQPSYDLAGRINIASPARVVDIGCGPGNSTQVLVERWPAAHIVGLDSSPEMLAQARQVMPDRTWILADAATWEPGEQFDVVFSNATLQWIPHHETLIGRLFSLVSPGGALAVQIPANSGSPLFQALVRVAQSEPWRDLMAGVDRRLTFHRAGVYYDLLAARSPRVFVWETTYYHVMVDHQGLIDWYSSTGMRPYLERLPDAGQRTAFQQAVLAACRDQYPRQQDQKVLFPFNRLFFVAYNTPVG